MPDVRALSDVLVHATYDKSLRDLVAQWSIPHFVNILFVVDGSISTDPVNDFGLATVIAELRAAKVGSMRFRVDIARRNPGASAVNPAPSKVEPKYTGFRFDMMVDGAPVIDKYEQVWCFGFNPGNSGLPDDSLITAASAVPASVAELNALDAWMTNRKGGVFGTGDHHFLGASMCSRIPRLGTMRRWTNADGVPPQGRSDRPNPQDRIDTLRPPSPDYLPGAPNQRALDNGQHEGDLTVQPIRWVADGWGFNTIFSVRSRPHPVLCHPTLGPIDVMPDHGHEGLCVPSPNLDANKKWKAEKEYPEAINGGAKPKPKIIAYGSNLASPPYLFTKGVQPARDDNPMIAVYDGHRAGVGRVATDSTWHHWFDANIDEIRAADTTDWKKIRRYYLNLAVWLNPPGYSTSTFYFAVVASHFQTVGFQEYSATASASELGQALRSHLQAQYGPCWVTEQVRGVLDELEMFPKNFPFPELEERFPGPLLDGALLETLILGELVKATFEPAEQVRAAAFSAERASEQRTRVKALAAPQRLFAQPVRAGLASFIKETRRHCDAVQGMTEMLFSGGRSR